MIIMNLYIVFLNLILNKNKDNNNNMNNSPKNNLSLKKQNLLDLEKEFKKLIKKYNNINLNNDKDNDKKINQIEFPEIYEEKILKGFKYPNNLNGKTLLFDERTYLVSTKLNKKNQYILHILMNKMMMKIQNDILGV